MQLDGKLGIEMNPKVKRFKQKFMLEIEVDCIVMSESPFVAVSFELHDTLAVGQSTEKMTMSSNESSCLIGKGETFGSFTAKRIE